LKYLIVGLGNIGNEYFNTRHNIGFKILDALAEASNICFKQERHAFRCEYKFKGRTFILIKPTTYVNLSGKAVNYWLQKEKLSAEKLLVVSDDISLPFGKLRLKPKGNDAGHNGLKNITEVLGHQNYARLRFGIGNDFNTGRQVDYVLGEWTDDEKKVLPGRMDICSEIIQSFATIGVQRTMNLFNNR